MSDTSSNDPDTIERDIRRTQEDMSRTIERISDQLTPRTLFNALLDKADENDVDARMLLDGARRNPIALGLIAAGTIWLISDKDSKFPKFHSGSSGNQTKVDTHHRDYVDYMSSIEIRDGEDSLAYQQRRDRARANYFMLERRHDEDDSSFRQRLDDLTDKFREKRHAWMQTSEDARSAVARGANRTMERAQSLYDDNPLVGGLIAAAAGAALGSLIPLSRVEQEELGSLGAKARAMASEQKDVLTDTLREKKDELVQKADDALHEAPRPMQETQSSQPSQPTAFPESAWPGARTEDRDV